MTRFHAQSLRETTLHAGFFGSCLSNMLRRPILPILPTLMVLGLFGAGAEAANPNREWSITLDNAPSRLKFENGTFSIASGNSESGPVWTFAGTLQNLEPDSAGFYVGDLDGSHNSSLAFFEAKQLTWYHGVISGGQVVLSPVVGHIFHLENGPWLYPRQSQPVGAPKPQEASGLPTEYGRASAMAQPNSASPPSYPVKAQQHTSLGVSRSMDTTATLYGDGNFYAVTQANNGVWLTGYHGRAYVTLLNGDGGIITEFDSPVLGVTGTAFGKPVASCGWQANLAGDALADARSISIVQGWSPDYDTIPRNSAAWVKLVLEFLQALLPLKK